MIRTNLIRTARRFGSTIQSAPKEEVPTASSWAPSSIWEVLFIAGTGAFGVYELYKGMFLSPQLQPHAEIIAERTVKKPGKVPETEKVRVVATDRSIQTVTKNMEGGEPPVAPPLPTPPIL